jgi:rsbT co-antagonist protein RsbR
MGMNMTEQLLEQIKAANEALRRRVVELEQMANLATQPVATNPIWEQLVEGAIDGLATCTSDFVLTYANPAFKTMAGLGNQEITTFLPTMLSAADIERLRTSALPHAESQGRWNGQVTATRPNGTVWKAQLMVQPLQVAPDEEPLFALFAKDMTEQLRSEQKQHTNTLIINSLMNNFPVVIYMLDINGVFTFSDGRGLKELGLQPGQVVGASIFELYKDLPDIISIYQQALQGQSIRQLAQVGPIWFETWYEPMYETSGEMVGVLGIAFNVTEREAGTAERLALQEQMIESQQATLRELSTPLIPLADGVVALPLVGAIDPMRAQQIMETLLEGISEQQAETAIIDITGVKVVDTQVADALLRAARAAQLLGARVVLTGISAEVAQSLVGLGADLGTVVTRSNLQSGIAYALEQRY